VLLWLGGATFLLGAAVVAGYWLLPTPAQIERRWEQEAGLRREPPTHRARPTPPRERSTR
jgi:hypothetical protein